MPKDETEDPGNNSGSDLDIGDGNKRAKSLKKIEEEKDEFTKDFNNTTPAVRKYTSRRMKNFDD
jgi:hypothetical protein